ncbi:TRAP transporter large permease [Pelagibacterium halotolerans]|uniref:TRAP transporter large permease protein n=1 Tax=Pelagibacterium halotolerans (strain DSM 22347 / JCM 15775 / CGMCC 1.7692 / B2) TaxID=1082931 RepID=G4RC67_PELHB|nr:TRAP transporter large permease [Pelagibacterium halotolerans]AEQ52690.1 TRAP-type C4-dicarboxylate transport system, large permease component [Pelagibacterium halotolerans B2]QJR17609.1 TRAP transporter large permease [Pelagibacterium halotolerans]SEA84500.1 C4-dicarboxylate transporter, DctM subunit [Pelagibacterium halotolerans]
MIAVLFIACALILLVGAPIMVALGLSAAIALEIDGRPLIIVLQTVFQSLDSFNLMAIPFFVLAGNLMQSGGIARRLIALANALVGWIHGGLGAVAVVTSMLFATVSGSSSATTAAIGSTLIPAMQRKGYPKAFAASVTAASGELGAIIPPSIPMVIYGLAANVSVASLFIAGIIPGLLITASLVLTVYVVTRIKGFDEVVPLSFGGWMSGLWTAFRQALLALLMPALILGGIYGGFFTPTEASCVAVLYGLFVGLFVYRELSFKDLPRVLARSAVMSSIIMLIVAFAAVFAYLLTVNQVPQKVAGMLGAISDNPVLFLLLTNVLLLLVGMFIEALAAILILAPILAPVAVSFGIDPIHFGMVMIVNLAIGMVTPPVGVNLFVVCQIAGLKLEQLVRYLLIFLGVLIANVLIITYVPAVSTALL